MLFLRPMHIESVSGFLFQSQVICHCSFLEKTNTQSSKVRRDKEGLGGSASVKCLLCRHRTWVDSRTCAKMLGVVALTCDPNMEDKEELTGQSQSSLIDKLQSDQWDWRWCSWRWHLRLSSGHHMHTHMHTHAYVHIHTHTHTTTAKTKMSLRT